MRITITGNIGEGKTVLAARLYQLLKEAGYEVATNPRNMTAELVEHERMEIENRVVTMPAGGRNVEIVVDNTIVRTSG